jgi:CRP/FNR family cyclic AMP-dependent transcriptional regulator
MNTRNMFDIRAFLGNPEAGRTISHYEKGGTIFSQGEKADSVFYIHKGDVTLSVASRLGKDAIVGVLGRHEFFGEGCLSQQPRRMATATALADCKIMRIEKALMARTLHEEPAFCELFVSHLLTRGIRNEENLVDQLFNATEKRLARVLLLLTNFGKEGRPEPIIADISEDALADMVGSTRSRVNFFINKFQELGFVHYNGRLEVHSSLLTVLLHDTPPIGKVRSSHAPRNVIG